MQRISWAILCGAALIGMGVEASGDILLLKNGGRIQGTILNREKFPKEYIVETADKAVVTLDRSLVEKIDPERKAEQEYAEKIHEFPDTTEGQLALAEWCRKNYLTDQREAHLRRVIEISPDDESARRALGYSMINGQWLTRAEWAERNGLVEYQGRYITPQEIELKERNRKSQRAQKDWFEKLDRWRDALERGGDKMETAVREIAAIDDPFAVPAIVKKYKDEKLRNVRLLYVEALGNINSAMASRAMVLYSIEDPDQELRLTCLETLAKRKSAAITQLYFAMLKDKENYRVRRAAIGLRSVGDAIAIGPLIDALVTKHVYIVQPANPGEIQGAFQRPGNAQGAAGGNKMGGLGVGGNKPRRVSKKEHNTEALATLTALTGVDFGYDKARWKNWLAAQKKSDSLDARRD